MTTAEAEEYHVMGASWDGHWLAYTRRQAQDEEGNPNLTVYLINLNTGESKALGEVMTNSGAFSPDGRYMVSAIEVENGRTDIVEYDLATGRVTPIAAHAQWDWLPSYSPDGAKIVFNTWRFDDQADMVIYDRASGALERLTQDPRYDAHGEFSPNGRKLLFHRMIAEKEAGGYDFELFVIDLETGQERQLTKGSPHEESYASWAPDGAHVVFSTDQDGKPEKHNLYVLGPDGEITDRLTRGDWKDSYAYWSRDSKYIYFTSDRDGLSNVYRIPMDGLGCKRPSHKAE